MSSARGLRVFILKNSITVEKHVAEVFENGAFSLILNLDMPPFFRLGPSSLNDTVLELDIFHTPPFDGATLVIGEYLRTFNIARNTR